MTKSDSTLEDNVSDMEAEHALWDAEATAAWRARFNPDADAAAVIRFARSGRVWRGVAVWHNVGGEREYYRNGATRLTRAEALAEIRAALADGWSVVGYQRAT